MPLRPITEGRILRVAPAPLIQPSAKAKFDRLMHELHESGFDVVAVISKRSAQGTALLHGKEEEKARAFLRWEMKGPSGARSASLITELITRRGRGQRACVRLRFGQS